MELHDVIKGSMMPFNKIFVWVQQQQNRQRDFAHSWRNWRSRVENYTQACKGWQANLIFNHLSDGKDTTAMYCSSQLCKKNCTR